MSLLLVVSIIVTGSNLDMMSSSIYANQKSEENENTKDKITELTNERTGNTSTYLLNDGTKKLEVYSENVRYKENGRWIDYDSSLKELEISDYVKLKNIVSDSEYKDDIDTDGYKYVNTDGDAKHYFAQTLNEKHPVVMNKDDYVISFAPVTGNAGDNAQQNAFPDTTLKSVQEELTDETLFIQLDEMLSVTEITEETDMVSYSDKKKSIEYSYTSLNDGVKEDIILFNKPDTNIFEYRYETPGLKAIAYDENNIILVDRSTESAVAQISAPYVMDGQGNISYDDVSMELVEEAEGIYIVKLIVDEEYLGDSSKYPVTIDPAVSWNCSSIFTRDEASDMSTGMPGSYRFITGVDEDGYEKITYFACNSVIGQIKGKHIEEAVFNATVFSIQGEPTINVKDVESSWSFLNLNSNDAPELSDKTYLSYSLEGCQAGDNISLSFTEIVQELAQESMASYGIALKTENEEPGNIVTFYGDAETAEPSFTIVYSEPIDINASYDGSFGIDGEYVDEEGITLTWNEYSEDIDSYQIYVRENAGAFSLIGITEGLEYTYTPNETLEMTDFRVMAVDKGTDTGTAEDDVNYLSNIVSFEKQSDTSTDEEGNEITSVTYEQVTFDTDGDELEDGYEIWDFKTLWNTVLEVTASEESGSEGNSTQEDSGEETESSESGDEVTYDLDTDKDGFPDSYEVFTLGTDPAVANPANEDGTSVDSDKDGLSDLKECQMGTDPWAKDSDFDGIVDKGDEEPRKTEDKTSQTRAADTEVHTGLYDREYSETEDGVAYAYITNIYRGNIKQIKYDYGDSKLNKTIKYFYDERGNNTAIVEAYDESYDPNHTQTICITYTYNEDNDVTFICDQETCYSMSYENGEMTSLRVGNQELVSYANSNPINNEENIENLAVGALVSRNEKTITYGKDDTSSVGTIKTITITYKVAENDTTSVETAEEIYYDGSEDISYKTEYTSDGNIKTFYDYTKNKENPVTYNYAYTETGTSVVRSDGFSKTVTEENVEDSGNSENNDTSITTTTYGFKNLKNEDVSYRCVETTDLGEDSLAQNSIVLYNGDTSRYTYDSEKKEGVSQIYSELHQKNILEFTQTEVSNTAAIFDIDLEGENTEEDKNIDYVYDLAGNITRISVNDIVKYEYTYDAHGRLTSEKDYVDGKYHEYIYNTTGNMDAHWIYSMDENGVVSEDEDSVVYYKYTDSDWPDQLSKYNGQTITYDNLGNPTEYHNGLKFEWERGRQLSGFKYADNTTDVNDVTYEYNESGLRTYKETNIASTTYEWDESNLLRETVTYKATNKTYDIWYYYDNNGEVIGFEYSYLYDLGDISRNRVYYEKDIQGNVIGLLDSSGTEIATYFYDAWGNITESKCLEGYEVPFMLNHVTYRGYYRDDESGFYYLQSRYYDPEVGRFINADDVNYLGVNGSIWGYNMYIYCENNPVNYVDSTGTLSLNVAMAKIKEILNKIVGKFSKYLKSLIKYNASKKTLSFSVTLISTAIDALIATAINGFIYRRIKGVMKLLLKNNSIRKNFVNSMFNFFLNNSIGKVVLWTIVKVGLTIAGRPGLIGTVSSGIFKGFLSNIYSYKNTALKKVSSLVSAFSSVGGGVAFFLDIMDGKWDDYVSMKILDKTIIV